mmetsp:Transcript_91378/g.279684  ORF Transcript_91378/g.279684 Transcript_91378/m.279684 type:complete len:126 (-) Transcript_91378:87-464(-)
MAALRLTLLFLAAALGGAGAAGDATGAFLAKGGADGAPQEAASAGSPGECSVKSCAAYVKKRVGACTDEGCSSRQHDLDCCQQEWDHVKNNLPWWAWILIVFGAVSVVSCLLRCLCSCLCPCRRK